MIKVPGSSRPTISKSGLDTVSSSDKPSHSSRPSGSTRPTPVSDMTQCVKLLSEDMHRPIDVASLNDLLTDNVGFLVVGAIGLQGSGKSTVLNCLSEVYSSSTEKPFPVEDLDSLVNGLPATFGIDMFVTPDRVIFLDSQPVLSLSLNEAICCSNTKRKLWQNSNHADSSDNQPTFHPDNWSEMTSLMMLSFLFSVCHVVIVVEDYFTNFDLLHLINTASMIKPSIYTSKNSTNNNSNDLVSQEKDVIDYHAKIVFVQNKAPSPALLQAKLKNLQLVLSQTVCEHRVNQSRERLWHNKLSRSSQEPEEKPITKTMEDSAEQVEKTKSVDDNEPNLAGESAKNENSSENEVVYENKLSVPNCPQSNSHSVSSTQREVDQETDAVAVAGSGGIIAANHIDALKNSATKSNDKPESEGIWTSSSASAEEDLNLIDDSDLPDLFILPLFNSDPVSSITPPFSEGISQLRKFVFSITRYPMIKIYPQPFTEKRWLQFCKKMWESIIASPLLGDYHRHLNAS